MVGAAGEHRLLHRARRRALELVHRVHADADHGAGAGLRRAGRAVARRRRHGARRVRRLDRAARHRLVVHVAASCWRSAWRSACRIAAAPYEMTRYYSMRDVATVRYAIGISMAAAGADRLERDDPRHRHARHLPVPAVARSGVEHHGLHGDVAAARLAVPGRDAVGDHVDGQLDPARHRRRVRARPLQAAGQPGGVAAPAGLGQPPLDRRARRACRSGSRRCKLGDVQAIVIEQAKFIASFFFVPVVLGLNWRRGTKEGAIWSMVAGFARLPGLDVHAAAQLRVARHRLGGGRRRAERAGVRPRQPR